ncbi:MAG: BTAD domain-containing putative transcriptional regulator [Actinomycetota bacterium]|nr:BTAD domain-containing putative transcriptional regulator [Actinomycetota bacterium]
MDLRVLGPIEVADEDGAVPIGGPRQRLVLALLILNAGETVSTDRLVDGVWGDDPPDAARRTVQAYVSNLRKELEAIRPETLVARSPGYALIVDAQSVDARRFEDAVIDGHSLLEASPSAAAATLRDALALWRGAPYADLAGAVALRPEITRLEELRRSAVELRIDADLSLGLHGQVIGELETLVAEHPLSERFATQLMLALYRSNRQADALRIAQRTRTVLGEELGIDASPALRDLEQSILEHSPDLTFPTVPHSTPESAGPDVIRGFEIRRPIGSSHWGKTYVAYQRSLEREVAVKVINPLFSRDDEFMERFHADISQMIRVTHPNIVPFYDTWRDSDGAYIVRRYFPRGSLQDAISRGSWNPEDTARLITQIGSALEAVHRNGRVHGDVKPSDIMLDEHSNAYITDFALPMSVFGGEEAFLAHRRADGNLLSDEELLAERTPQIDIRGLSATAREMIDGTDVSPGIAAVLDKGSSVDASDRYMTMAEFVEAFGAASGDRGTPVVPISHNPYKGLRAFSEADAGDFFGREEFVSSLVPRLARSGPGCLVLVGASGIGKSSIVNAGLIPALRSGSLPGSQSWHIVKMHPGVHPYGELAGALRQISAGTDPQALGHLTWGDISIGEALTSTFGNPTGDVLLVIDQFEELFTLVRDESVRASFIESLVDAVDDPNVHLRLVLALRADFYDRPLRYPRLAALLSGCMITVMPMTAAELETAITKPALRAGAELDPGLAGRIVDDVHHQPGVLPLVQYALTDLFDHRDGNRITAEAYENSGGVRGPLATRPEATYFDLSAEAQAAARQIFLHLVAVNDDGEAARRRVQRSELTSIVGYEHAAGTVIDSFGDARLLSFDRHPVTRSPTVEIAHDALLTKWDRLRGWVDDHRSDVRLLQRLANATADWISSNKDPEFLLVGGMLDRLEGWSKATDLALSDAERSLIEASVDARDFEEREEVARVEHEHEVEDQAQRRLRMLIGVWALTGLVAVLAVFAFAQWRRSENLASQAEAVATANQLARSSDAERESDPELALLLALRAVESTAEQGFPATIPAEEALHLAMHSASVMYPSEDGDVRIIPDRIRDLAGVYLLPIDNLVDAARSSLTRGFTASECTTYLDGDCPAVTIASPATEAPPSDVMLALASTSRQPTGESARLAGTTVSVGGDLSPEWFADFQQETGITLVAADDGDADVLGLPIGDAAAAARRGDALDLSLYLDRDELIRLHGEYPVHIGTMAANGESPASDGLLFGVNNPGFVEGLVWHRLASFREHGYSVPHTWDQMIDLSDEMVADGLTPWCLGTVWGAGLGGRDALRIVENLLLSAEGPGTYNAWMTHQIPADHPAVRSAFERLGQLVFTPGYVSDPAVATSRDAVGAATSLLNGECEMFPSNLVAPFWAFPSPVGLGSVVSAFPFPAVDPNSDPAVIGPGGVIIAAKDRPEVREFMRHVTSRHLEATTGIGILDDVTETRLQKALADGSYRPMALQATPPGVGITSYDDRPSAYHRGVVSYLENGPDSLDEILAQIEGSWPSPSCKLPRDPIRVTGMSACPDTIDEGHYVTIDGVELFVGERYACTGDLSAPEVSGDFDLVWNVDLATVEGWGEVVIINDDGTWVGDVLGHGDEWITKELWGTGAYEGLVYRATERLVGDEYVVDGTIEPAC